MTKVYISTGPNDLPEYTINTIRKSFLYEYDDVPISNHHIAARFFNLPDDIDIMLVLIGSNWNPRLDKSTLPSLYNIFPEDTIKDEHRQFRLQEPEQLNVKEITQAMTRNMPIIPVLVDTSPDILDPIGLPESLHRFAFGPANNNIIYINKAYLHEGLQHLKSKIQEFVNPEPRFIVHEASSKEGGIPRPLLALLITSLIMILIYLAAMLEVLSPAPTETSEATAIAIPEAPHWIPEQPLVIKNPLGAWLRVYPSSEAKVVRTLSDYELVIVTAESLNAKEPQNFIFFDPAHQQWWVRIHSLDGDYGWVEAFQLHDLDN